MGGECRDWTPGPPGPVLPCPPFLGTWVLHPGSLELPELSWYWGKRGVRPRVRGQRLELPTTPSRRALSVLPAHLSWLLGHTSPLAVLHALQVLPDSEALHLLFPAQNSFTYMAAWLPPSSHVPPTTELT